MNPAQLLQRTTEPELMMVSRKGALAWTDAHVRRTLTSGEQSGT